MTERGCPSGVADTPRLSRVSREVYLSGQQTSPPAPRRAAQGVRGYAVSSSERSARHCRRDSASTARFDDRPVRSALRRAPTAAAFQPAGVSQGYLTDFLFEVRAAPRVRGVRAPDAVLRSRLSAAILSRMRMVMCCPPSGKRRRRVTDATVQAISGGNASSGLILPWSSNRLESVEKAMARVWSSWLNWAVVTEGRQAILSFAPRDGRRFSTFGLFFIVISTFCHQCGAFDAVHKALGSPSFVEIWLRLGCVPLQRPTGWASLVPWR